MDPNQIPRTSVTSSNVAEIGYDANSFTLVVLFNKGGLYMIRGVTPEVHDEFINASSIGKYYNEVFRNGSYTVEKV